MAHRRKRKPRAEAPARGAEGGAETAAPFRRRLVVVFRPSHVKSYEDGPGTQLAPALRKKFGEFAATVAGATLVRAFRRPAAADKIVARAKAATGRSGWPTFRTWFSLELDPTGDERLDDHARTIASWAKGIRTEVVDFARRGPGWVAPLGDPIFAYVNGDAQGQRHLGPASGDVRIHPDGHCTRASDEVDCCTAASTCTPMPKWAGVDAMFGWRFPGGDGRGTRLGDVEIWWTTSHTDFPPHSFLPADAGTVGDAADALHGTGTIVTACGRATGGGAVGCAPGAEHVILATQIPPDSSRPLRERVHGAIADAAAALGELDVLLIEAQTRRYLPVDRWWTVRALIRTVTAGKIIVVEPAGTWQFDGAATEAPDRDLDLQRWSGDDSGAIIVSATDPWLRSWKPHCPYGARIDCHAWGAAVRSSDRMELGSPAHSTGYNGSSAAAAIVAGLALQITGIARVHGITAAVTPTELRKLLRNPALGSLSCDAAERPIGPMPDLAKILESGLSLPHLFLRSRTGDEGLPTWFGTVGSAPDIAVTLGTAVPEVRFGIRNRGSVDAPDAVVDAYVGPPSPVAPGIAWRHLGTSAAVAVPHGGAAETSPFPVGAPGPGALFVGVLGSAGVPPAPVDQFAKLAQVLWSARALGKVAWTSALRLRSGPLTRRADRKAAIELWIPAGAARATSFRFVGPSLRTVHVSLRLDAANAAQLRPAGIAAPQTLAMVRVGLTASHRLLRKIPSTSADRRIRATLVVATPDAWALAAGKGRLDLVQTFHGQEIGRMRIAF